MKKNENSAKYNENSQYYEVELKAPEVKGNFATKVTVTDLFENKLEEFINIPVLEIDPNTEIKRILSELNIPIAHLKYKGNKKTYIIWTIIDEQPIFSSDDEINFSEITIDIDIYSESNYLSIMSSVKKIMKENEWIWDGDSEESFEEDTKLYHRTCTFLKERMIWHG